MVRVYCAYNITDRTYGKLQFVPSIAHVVRRIYQMALWTYAFVLIHYGLELIVYRSVKLNAGLLSPVIVGGRSGTL
jgi:hypothetical protein